MRTDVQGERAVGKITRTAAGGAATLTIVWQEFRFQLCTTLSFQLLSFLLVVLFSACMYLHKFCGIKS